MKRLNKKGFTLVELLAAIVILAVLMLVGAQAVAGIMRNSRANSLLSSLDMAAKQANVLLAQGEIGFAATPNDLTAALNYNKDEYSLEAFTDNEGKYLFTQLKTNPNGSFSSVKCNHGKIKDKVYDGDTLKPIKFIWETQDEDVGYYCGADATTVLVLTKIEKVAN